MHFLTVLQLFAASGGDRGGTTLQMQAHCHADMSYDNVLEKVLRKTSECNYRLLIKL